MDKFSYLENIPSNYLEELLVRFNENPSSIDSSWRYFFEGFEFGTDGKGFPDESPISNGSGSSSEVTSATTATSSANRASTPQTKEELLAEANVFQLILAYRRFGKYHATINPLLRDRVESQSPHLEPARYGLSQGDFQRTFKIPLKLGLPADRLDAIVAHLRVTYCGNTAFEIEHIEDETAQHWLQQKIEQMPNQPDLDAETQRLILRRLSESETLERFLHTRYVAQKRFSLEGGESLIPALDSIIEQGGELGAKEFILGMAHRGRLNVLVNLCGKNLEALLVQFEGNYEIDTTQGEGDVKYHMGFSADIQTRHGKHIHLSLGSNPSHLEFINPVVEGATRAKQDMTNDRLRSQIIPILIHGDAALAGQGVCYETLNFSMLQGYRTGGTIHIVVNNQVGFTTSPHQYRSSAHSTDIAKMLDVPIFHVNGDDPESVWKAAQLAMEYRQKFSTDVFLDIVCYRKHGHNEADEPSFTQPLLYKMIKAHPSTREIYAKKLLDSNVISESDAQRWVNEVTEALSQAQSKVRVDAPQPTVSALEGRWKKLKFVTEEELSKPVHTAVLRKKILELGEKLNITPETFRVHPKLTRFFEARLRAIKEGVGIDWGNAESLAFASLLDEGHRVRLSGQDVERGTFTHRHAVLSDVETGKLYINLNHVRKDLYGNFQIFNSSLSESGVLGFEYGYSIAAPFTLVLWEAQFGDFANGAQVIIDQFIATSESKWRRSSGLVLLLPHGFEGQGPEHSSARIERFLQLSGKNNLTVCNFTTPAQFFHALRRQLLREFRIPLIVFTPKSLLRHPQAVSTVGDLAERSFEEVLDDPEALREPMKVQRVILCSGKIYYELLNERNSQNRSDVAILRIEQLYPFPKWKLSQAINSYESVKSILWVQEEPRNMGAWTFIFNHWQGGYDFFCKHLKNQTTLQYVGREIGAAPAVGSHKLHEKEQHLIIKKAFSDETAP